MPTGTLLLAAQSEQAILPAIYEFFARYNIVPSEAQEFCNSAGRFARIEWVDNLDENLSDTNTWIEVSEFDESFCEVAQVLNLDYKVRFSHSSFRIGLFCLGVNECLEQVLQKYSPLSSEVANNNMHVAFLVGNSLELQTAANRYGIPYFHIEATAGVARETQLLRLISRYQPDLFAMMPSAEGLSAGLLAKLPCSVLSVSEAVVPSNAPGLVLDVASAGAGVLLASAFLLRADVNRPQLVVQQSKPLVQKREFLHSGSQQQDLECEVLVRALTKFTYNKVIAYGNYLYAFD